VVFEYNQPLRITEIKFKDLSLSKTITKGLRFLAQPGERYRIYFDTDQYTDFLAEKETGNLSMNKGVVLMNSNNYTKNNSYKPIDSDMDSVPNVTDNCIGIENSDQKDSDGNGVGDACEDYDRDGVVNEEDNCPNTPNAWQEDVEQDGVGDVCDQMDNRVTERIPWLPWLGIGVAGVVLLGLFVMTLKYKKQDESVI